MASIKMTIDPFLLKKCCIFVESCHYLKTFKSKVKNVKKSIVKLLVFRVLAPHYRCFSFLLNLTLFFFSTQSLHVEKEEFLRDIIINTTTAFTNEAKPND